MVVYRKRHTQIHLIYKNKKHRVYKVLVRYRNHQQGVYIFLNLVKALKKHNSFHNLKYSTKVEITAHSSQTQTDLYTEASFQ